MQAVGNSPEFWIVVGYRAALQLGQPLAGPALGFVIRKRAISWVRRDHVGALSFRGTGRQSRVYSVFQDTSLEENEWILAQLKYVKTI